MDPPAPNTTPLSANNRPRPAASLQASGVQHHDDSQLCWSAHDSGASTQRTSTQPSHVGCHLQHHRRISAAQMGPSHLHVAKADAANPPAVPSTVSAGPCRQRCSPLWTNPLSEPGLFTHLHGSSLSQGVRFSVQAASCGSAAYKACWAVATGSQLGAVRAGCSCGRCWLGLLAWGCCILIVRGAVASGRATKLSDAQKRPPSAWLRLPHKPGSVSVGRRGLKSARSSCQDEHGVRRRHTHVHNAKGRHCYSGVLTLTHTHHMTHVLNCTLLPLSSAKSQHHP